MTIPDSLSCLMAAFPPASTHVGAESPLVRSYFWATVAAAWVLTFVRQRGQRNYSIVDRMWPLYPPTFLALWQWQTGCPDISSVALVAHTLVFVWSARLCFNSIRRGDYRVGAEDYRWAVVGRAFDRALGKGFLRVVVWEVFNLGFITVFQLALLYMLALPVRLVTEDTGARWTPAAALWAGIAGLLLVVEAVADQQQWAFQQAKRREDTRLPFVTGGLWQWSRHPNVFCEQAFWLVLCFFCAAAAGVDLGAWEHAANLIGPALLIVLMWASVGLTERISLSRYPAYRAYQVKTSRLVPWPPLSDAQVIATAALHAK
ncbi:hypothetical protein LPJ53_001757 [Coemansia erecta]|uniref:DUF1295-domain-containing protein n=1 Tax=Coemansia erecta TaxID=147472 RepID=A0A9W7Y497_9FUNG|nr:hypothetical protein LPJ53_001757 [Coemansia erecta]